MLLDKSQEIMRFDLLLVSVVEHGKVFPLQFAQPGAGLWSLTSRTHGLVKNEPKGRPRGYTRDRALGNRLDVDALVLMQASPFSAQSIDFLPVFVNRESTAA
jgi:hypothetical protein